MELMTRGKSRKRRRKGTTDSLLVSHLPLAQQHAIFSSLISTWGQLPPQTLGLWGEAWGEALPLPPHTHSGGEGFSHPHSGGGDSGLKNLSPAAGTSRHL